MMPHEDIIYELIIRYRGCKQFLGYQCSNICMIVISLNDCVRFIPTFLFLCVIESFSVPFQHHVISRLETAALLRRAEEYTTLKAISRASGLKLSVLKKYASAEVYPRAEQREKIVAALKKIAKDLLLLSEG